MTQDIFKICKSGNGLTLLGVNIPRGLSPDDVFFSSPYYGETPYICTSCKITIPSKMEFEGELLDIVEICGHPFEECDDLEELVIPETVRRIHWNGCGRAKLSKFTVHHNNPIFQDIEGVLYTRKGYNREGKRKYNWIELVAYPSGKGTEYKVPNGVTRLGNQSFKYTAISHLELPNTLKEIGKNVFYGCSKLKELVVPSSVIKDEGSSNCSTFFKTI